MKDIAASSSVEFDSPISPWGTSELNHLWTPKLSHPAKAQGRKAIGIQARLTASLPWGHVHALTF
jgi:hypothetical protein